MQGGTANPFGGRPARDLVGGHSAPAAKPVADPLRAIPAGELLEVPLASLCEAWPEVLRKEIVSLGLVDAKVALPLSLVEQGLRKGRVNFDWKTLRLFVRPAMPPSTSPHDSVVAELPLKVVAPLFLTRKSEAAQAKQRVAVDEEIPNLFFGTPHSDSTTFAQVAAPAPLAPASARPGDTNFYAREDYQDATRAAAMESRRGPTPGTKFAVKYATPNEIVSRASELPGVVGALIALPDGLMVANRLPSDLNADTLAAFLPQIYAKVSQCTKELRMGELNNLNFTVGNVPWKIFRVNAIFFAAFGRPGEPLPTAQLAALAAELDHKPK
ncbi:MAG TPA: roadblock/LC7 domain-containing protein, partial [Clostridia bacterium]|nr:roadblock/LC7 domain-containing protein [Clostridia bacterium]